MSQVDNISRSVASTRTQFVFVCSLLLVSIALNIVLARRLESWEVAQVSDHRDRILQVSAVVPSIAVKEPGGNSGGIRYEDATHPTVLYVFTPQCSWCSHNLDNVRVLEQEQKEHYRFIGLSLSDRGSAEYAVRNGLNIPVYSGLSDETRRIYKLSGTPETIVVSPEGKVLKVWMGAYVGKNKEEIEAYFHVHLPGLRNLPAPDQAGDHSAQTSPTSASAK